MFSIVMWKETGEIFCQRINLDSRFVESAINSVTPLIEYELGSANNLMAVVVQVPTMPMMKVPVPAMQGITIVERERIMMT